MVKSVFMGISDLNIQKSGRSFHEPEELEPAVGRSNAVDVDDLEHYIEPEVSFRTVSPGFMVVEQPASHYFTPFSGHDKNDRADRAFEADLASQVSVDGNQRFSFFQFGQGPSCFL